jgi:subtilisin family serine protease
MLKKSLFAVFLCFLSPFAQNINSVNEAKVPGYLIAEASTELSREQMAAIEKNSLVMSVTPAFKIPQAASKTRHGKSKMALFQKSGLGRFYRISTYPGEEEAARKFLMDLGLFFYAEQDQKGGQDLAPNDPYWSQQSAFETSASATSSSYGEISDLDLTTAWDIHTGDSNTIVAVLDMGFDVNHPEISPKLWVNEEEIPGDGIDNDNNGYVDDVSTYTFEYLANAPGVDAGSAEDNRHGTACAGIVGGASNDNFGVSGINWHAKLMLLNASASLAIAEAIQYAADQGADVLSVSMTRSTESWSWNPLCAAVEYAWDLGMIVVGSAGNYDSDTPLPPGACRYGVSVGATDHMARRVSAFSAYGWGSNYGDSLDIMAPGVLIGIPAANAENYYAATHFNGTSAATPIVAGIISLLKSYNPELTNDELLEILYTTASLKNDQISDDPNDIPGWDRYYGWGLVDPTGALEWVDETTLSIAAGFEAEVQYTIGEEYIISSTEEFRVYSSDGSYLGKSFNKRFSLASLQSGVYYLTAKNTETQSVFLP